MTMTQPAELQMGRVQVIPAEVVGRAGLIKVQTGEAPAYHDITDQVARFLEASQVTLGQLVVFSKHTTAPIWVNENEPLLQKDMRKFLERIAPRGADYLHNELDIRTVNMNPSECPNGHAHIQHGFMGGAAATIPVIGGKLALGRYQSIFLVELDRPRPREVVLQILGLTNTLEEVVQDNGGRDHLRHIRGPW